MIKATHIEYETKVEILAVLKTTSKKIAVTVSSKHDAFFVPVTRKAAINLIMDANEDAFYIGIHKTTIYIHSK